MQDSMEVQAMSTETALTAVGAYLQYLRDGLGMSRVELAGKVKTNESQIIRIEAGTIDTRSSLLFAIIDAVRGDPNHIRRLMNSKATTEDARQLAQAVLRGFQEGGALKHVKTSEDIAELMTLFEEELTNLQGASRNRARDALLAVLEVIRASRKSDG